LEGRRRGGKFNIEKRSGSWSFGRRNTKSPIPHEAGGKEEGGNEQGAVDRWSERGTIREKEL